MDFAIILLEFKNISLNIIQNLSGTVGTVMYYLAVIDLTLSMLFNKDEDINIFYSIFGKVLLYGFFIYLLKNYAYIIEIFEKGFVQLGNVATGNGRGTNLTFNPGEIFSDTMALLVVPIIAGGGASILMDLAGVESLPAIIMFTSFGIVLTAGATSLIIMFVFIKFYLTSAVTILTLAFGVFSKSKDIALKGLVGLFSQGIELTFTVIVFNFITKFYKQYILNGLKGVDGQPVALLNILVIMIFFFMLVKRIPLMVSTVLSGSISSMGVGSGAGSMASNALKQGASAASNTVKSTIDAYKNATSNKTK